MLASAAPLSKSSNLGIPKPMPQVGGFTFWLFIYFNIDFFLHLSARIPGYGVVRPTLLIVLILTLMLYSQREKFLEVYSSEPFKRLKSLIIYILATFLIVRWPGSVIGNLPEFVKAACFFFFTAMIVDSEKRLRIFIFVFMCCQLIRVLEPLYLNITEGYWGDKTYIGDGEFAQRLSGAPSDIINPNELGFVIVTLVPFLYFLCWRGRYRSKLLFLILMPPIMYALILTMSRGAFVALLIVGWIIFRKSKYKSLLLLAAIGGAIAGWSVMSDIQKDRYLSLVSSDTVGAATAEGRLDGMVGEFVLGLTTRPLFGNGLGTTSEAKFHEWGKGKASHNLYAELLIEVGIVGLWFFLGYMRQLLESQRNLRCFIGESTENSYEEPFWFNLVECMSAVFWMYAIYSLNYYGLSTYYWYLFGGLVVAVERVYREKVVAYGK